MKSFELDNLNQTLEIDGFVDLTGLIDNQQIETINNRIEIGRNQPHANGQRGYEKERCSFVKNTD